MSRFEKFSLKLKDFTQFWFINTYHEENVDLGNASLSLLVFSNFSDSGAVEVLFLVLSKANREQDLRRHVVADPETLDIARREGQRRQVRVVQLLSNVGQ